MITVIKFGGHAMSDNDGHFGSALLAALSQGHQLAIVHGGGPQINSALEGAGIASHFIGGFRVTTPEIFEVVEQVLSNEVGPQVARTLHSSGVRATAISGRKILVAQKQTTLVDGTPADLGLVGEVVGVNPSELEKMIAGGQTPVISPVASDLQGNGLNVNADIAAAAVAGALQAQELIIMTDVAGIYRNWPDASSLIEEISSSDLEAIKGTFAEGMAPKVQATLDAISAGAQAVRIIDGRNPQALADALAHNGGTLVVA
jgi:acetylglutamate kinase